MVADRLFGREQCGCDDISREEQDKMDGFNLGISGYMLKPSNYIKLIEVIRTIDLYWTLSETVC